MVQENVSDFIWDLDKEKENVNKHSVDFSTAAQAFKDPKIKIYFDSKHEERFFCIGKVDGKVLTIRFTYRGNKIRIIGAGYWRKGEDYYEQKD